VNYTETFQNYFDPLPQPLALRPCGQGGPCYDEAINTTNVTDMSNMTNITYICGNITIFHNDSNGVVTNSSIPDPNCPPSTTTTTSTSTTTTSSTTTTTTTTTRVPLVDLTEWYHPSCCADQYIDPYMKFGKKIIEDAPTVLRREDFKEILVERNDYMQGGVGPLEEWYSWTFGRDDPLHLRNPMENHLVKKEKAVSKYWWIKAEEEVIVPPAETDKHGWVWDRKFHEDYFKPPPGFPDRVNVLQKICVI
jgi:hypothetical protein